MILSPQTELQSYEDLLIGHLESFLRGLRKLKPEHWDWTPDPAAPTARTVAVHAWQWLMCDRQHINEPDISRHPNVREAPTNLEEFCQAFEAEIEEWRLLLRRLSPQDLLEPRWQFGNKEYEMNVRHFIGHMVQNVIYKHGQFSELFFALGYDGKEPYSAPFPNEIYDQIRSAATAS